MAAIRSAGDLRQSVAFEERVELDRGDGTKVGDWVERFSTRAGFVHLMGGESVMAGRLAGRHPQVIFVRAQTAARAVTPEWRIIDKRSGVAFNIRDITPSGNGLWLDFLCESGVNPG